MGIRIGGSLGPVSVSVPLTPRGRYRSRPQRRGPYEPGAIAKGVDKGIEAFKEGWAEAAMKPYACNLDLQPGDIVGSRIVAANGEWITFQTGDVVNGHLLTSENTWAPINPALIVNGHILNADQTAWLPVRVLNGRVLERNSLETMYDEADDLRYDTLTTLWETLEPFTAESGAQAKRDLAVAIRKQRDIRNAVATEGNLLIPRATDKWERAAMVSDYKCVIAFIDGALDRMHEIGQAIDVNLGRHARGLPLVPFVS